MQEERVDSELGLKDYLAILKRRGTLFFLIAAPILTLAVGLAFRLPAVYESTGILLAEQADVPEDLVPTTVPDFPDERVRRITDRVLTDENLTAIIEEHDPYPMLRDDREEAIRQVRRNVVTEAEDPEMLPSLIGGNENTIVFSVGFRHGSPNKARDIARQIVSLYLSENQRARQELAAETLSFLQAQARRLEEQIAEKEAELAEFKRENAGRLPELSDMNMQLLDRTERDLEAVEGEIRTLRSRVSLIESELTQLSPYSVVTDEEGNPILSPADRLKMLQRQYVAQSAIYSQDHPDIVRMRREIETLSRQTGLPGIDRSILETTLSARLQELEAARERGLSDEHPDIVRLQMAIDNLRSALEDAPRTNSSAAAAVAPPDNPIFIQRQVQLEAAQTDLNAAIERRDELRERLATLEQRLTATPEVEREFASLSRGYDQLVAQYNEVMRKQQEAAIAVNLESENRGERFSVLSSPELPTRPASPNRIAILLLGAALAFAGAAGGVTIAEVTDTTVRGPRDVHALLEIPPLVMIPNIDNEADVRERRWRRAAFAATVFLWLGVTTFFIMNPAG